MIPLEMWDAIKKTGGHQALRAFNKVWYEGGKLTPDEDTLRRDIFSQYPLGAENFKAWLKQITRQLFERWVKEQGLAKSVK